MWRALFFIVKLAILVAIAFWLAERPGELAVTWLGYRIETSVGVLLLGLYVIVLIAVAFYFLWRGLLRTPQQALGSILAGRRRRGYRALTHGMVAVAAGDADEARRWARKAEVLLDEPPLTLLLQAQAAQLGGDEDAARRYFTLMLDRGETRFMGLRGLLMQALRDSDDAAALGYLEQARRERPDAPWVVSGLLELQLKRGDLEGAQESLTRARRVKALLPEETKRKRAVLLVEQARQAQADRKTEVALSHVREAHKLAPALSAATILEAELLLAAGKNRAAGKRIEKAWAEQPHPQLAELYRKTLGDADPLARLNAIVRLTETRPDDRESLLARARAALDAQLWGETRRYLAAAAEQGNGETICRLMARLEEAERGDLAAARTWLDRAASAPPESAWICSSCGALASDWTASCGACGAFDSINWQRPPRIGAAGGESAVALIARPDPEDRPDLITAG